MIKAHMKKQCLLCEILTQRPLVETCSGVCGEPFACEGLFKAAQQGSAASRGSAVDAAGNETGVSGEMRVGIKNYRIEWDNPI